MDSITKSLAQPQISVFCRSTEVSTGIIQLEDDTNILLTYSSL